MHFCRVHRPGRRHPYMEPFRVAVFRQNPLANQEEKGSVRSPNREGATPETHKMEEEDGISGF